MRNSILITAVIAFVLNVAPDLVAEVQVPVEAEASQASTEPAANGRAAALPTTVSHAWSKLIGSWNISGHVGEQAVSGRATFEWAAGGSCYRGKQQWQIGARGRAVHLALLGGWDTVANETVEYGFSSAGDSAMVRYKTPADGETVVAGVAGRVHGSSTNGLRWTGTIELKWIDPDEFRLTSTVDGEVVHALTYTRN